MTYRKISLNYQQGQTQHPELLEFSSFSISWYKLNLTTALVYLSGLTQFI